MKTVLAIPAYNCANQLSRVLASIQKDEQLISCFSDILVIDNLSSDNTAKIALSYKNKIKNLKVFQNSKNYSLGGSHKVAFLYAEKVKATHVAILHGDDQAIAEELNNIIDVAQKEPNLDAVLGSRFMTGSVLQGYDFKRNAGNRVLNLIYSIMTLRKIKDLGSGLNLFKLKIFEDHTYLEFADKLTFNFEILLFLIGRKAKIKFYPITWRESDQISNARNFNVAKIAFINIFKWRFGKLQYKKTHKPSDYKSECL